MRDRHLFTLQLGIEVGTLGVGVRQAGKGGFVLKIGPFFLGMVHTVVPREVAAQIAIPPPVRGTRGAGS